MLNDEETLISRVLVNDDRHAFRQLVLHYQSGLRLFLRRVLGEEALADDCAQETWLIVYQKLSSFRGGSFRSWLLTIGMRRALRLKSKQGRLDLQDTPDDTAAPSVPEGLRLDLEKALQHLSLAERSCLHLMSCEDMTHEEIAKVLDLPLGTVKSHIARGKDKLRRLLAPVGEEKSHARR